MHRPTPRRTALVVALIAALGSVASTDITAATIELSKGQLTKIDTVPSGTAIPDAWLPRILISGPIVPGDERKFLATLKAAAAFETGQFAANPNLKQIWNARTVWLNSNGGDVSVAMEIGRLIRNNRLSTLIENDAV